VPASFGHSTPLQGRLRPAVTMASDLDEGSLYVKFDPYMLRIAGLPLRQLVYGSQGCFVFGGLVSTYKSTYTTTDVSFGACEQYFIQVFFVRSIMILTYLLINKRSYLASLRVREQKDNCV